MMSLRAAAASLIRQVLRCSSNTSLCSGRCAVALFWWCSDVQGCARCRCWRLVHLCNFPKVSPSQHFLFRCKRQKLHLCSFAESLLHFLSKHLETKTRSTVRTVDSTVPKTPWPRKTTVHCSGTTCEFQEGIPRREQFSAHSNSPTLDTLDTDTLAHAGKCWKD